MIGRSSGHRFGDLVCMDDETNHILVVQALVKGTLSKWFSGIFLISKIEVPCSSCVFCLFLLGIIKSDKIFVKEFPKNTGRINQEFGMTRKDSWRIICMRQKECQKEEAATKENWILKGLENLKLTMDIGIRNGRQKQRMKNKGRKRGNIKYEEKERRKKKEL